MTKNEVCCLLCAPYAALEVILRHARNGKMGYFRKCHRGGLVTCTLNCRPYAIQIQQFKVILPFRRPALLQPEITAEFFA